MFAKISLGLLLICIAQIFLTNFVSAGLNPLSVSPPCKSRKPQRSIQSTPTASATSTSSTSKNGAVTPDFRQAQVDRSSNGGISGSQFAGDITLPAAALVQLAKQNSLSSDSVVDSYKASPEAKSKVPIKGDWIMLPKSSAYYFVADMDVDCDGIDYKCDGNPDGLPTTDYGALSARQVPFAVIPEPFVQQHPDLKPNALVAVVCNNQLFYGIFGDSNGDDPLVLGEASILMAQTCFGSSMTGATGHSDLDVLYIFFTGDEAVVPGVGKNYLSDFSKLTTLGDSLMKNLVSDLQPALSGVTVDNKPLPIANAISSASAPASTSASVSTRKLSTATITTAVAIQTSKFLVNLCRCSKRCKWIQQNCPPCCFRKA